jgi:hypothetical protein
LTTFAVADIVICTGAGPQLKVITPPLATAATTAAEVQPAGVPVPMIVVGFEVSAACPAAGIAAWPLGLPGAGSWTDDGEGDAEGEGDGDADGELGGDDAAPAES